MALNTEAITLAVASLSIAGVRIRDLNTIPDEVLVRNCPVMFPAPGEIASGYENGPGTFGGATAAYWAVTRVMSWLYLHSPVGEGRGAFSHFPELMRKSDAIIEKFMELSITGVDILKVTIENASKPIEDPAGNQYYGFYVNVLLREKINA